MQLSATKKLAFSVTTLALALLVAEVAAQAIYRWRSPDDHWIFQAARRQHRLFEEHPFLSVAPIANVRSQHGDTVITHNRDGLRGYELSDDGNRPRIAALGGSSTYGVYVRDEHVWPHQLELVLGSDYEVLNLGVPGYTSVESTIQTAFFLSDLKPTTALYYVGWNDLRNVHVANLDPYYAEFHGASQPSNLDVHRTYPGWFALRFYLGRVSDILSYEVAPAVATQQKFTKDVDERPLSLFRRNIENIIALCRAQNIDPVFITHPLNADALTGEDSYGWIPYLKDRDLPEVMKLFNQTVIDVASSQQIPVIDAAASGRFTASDFADQGHFNVDGNRKFADFVAAELLERELVTISTSVGVRPNRRDQFFVATTR